MSESMIERVTKAIQAVGIERQNVAYSDFARAAIEAMREPTDEMLKPEVVSRTEHRLDGAHQVNYLLPIFDIWPKMIDAALSEKP